jgi:hypothetical protein
VADILAAGSGLVSLRGRPPISRLVVDAHIAESRPQFASAARQAGIPFLVDPLTPLLEGELRTDDAWARLPFGQPERVASSRLREKASREWLVESVVRFQVEMGATSVIPPYLYAVSPQDPRFEASLALIRETGLYLERNRIPLRIIPVLAAQLQRFAPEATWEEGVDRFRTVATEVDNDFIAMCLSPLGDGRDSYDKVLGAFNVAQRLQNSASVIAWRQGIYGEALVAAGVAGYESGGGSREQTNVARLVASRKPSKSETSGGGPRVGVYLEPIGRSVPKPVAQALLGSLQMRAKVMCDDESCCPDGPIDTLDHPREHAIRTRARALWALEAMPERSWRLHRIARKSRASATIARQATEILAKEAPTFTLSTTGLDSLSRVTQYLLEAGQTAAS